MAPLKNEEEEEEEEEKEGRENGYLCNFTLASLFFFFFFNPFIGFHYF